MYLKRSLLTAAALALAAAPALRSGAQTPDSEKKGMFYKFSLAPKSAQTNPRLDFTVATDVTPEGKALRQASSDHPAFYVLYSEGYKTHGDADRTLKTLSEADVSQVLQRSLGERGYHPAALPSHPPTLLILFNWGSYGHAAWEHVDWSFIGGTSSSTVDGTAVSGGFDQSSAGSVPGTAPDSAEAQKEMLERATLIGGARFAAQMRQQIQLRADAQYAQMSDMSVNGVTLAALPSTQLLDPTGPFASKSLRNTFMLDLVKDDLFYVIASAYDFQAYTRQHKAVLLWRTHMAISAGGVTQPQVLPTLVLAASPYFGKDTNGAVLLNRQMTEKIEIGAPKVVGYETPK